MKSQNSITLDKAVSDRITYYAYLTGKPVSVLVNEAINEWLEMSGELIIAELEERRRKRKKKTGKHNEAKATCINTNAKFRSGTVEITHTAAMCAGSQG